MVLKNFDQNFASKAYSCLLTKLSLCLHLRHKTKGLLLFPTLKTPWVGFSGSRIELLGFEIEEYVGLDGRGFSSRVFIFP